MEKRVIMMELTLFPNRHLTNLRTIAGLDNQALRLMLIDVYCGFMLNDNAAVVQLTELQQYLINTFHFRTKLGQDVDYLTLYFD